MRKLLTALSFAALAGAGIAGMGGTPAVADGGLRVVHEYPPLMNDEDTRHMLNFGWSRNGGRTISAAIAEGRDGSQTAGSAERGLGVSPATQKDCLGNFDGEGEPKGPMPGHCY